ncbi:hypothetical protein [Bifidobacterium parmae]|uniref:Uncharacterized protein n=1 Tax=Bifidobacterium parmae TaxID=361854 RepID=A0A2N5J0J7_9BIFI|nr:hypothetical protein [Bifidobacterium parmae]PLS27722.1 hypothetical protein Uis4E_1408 [Bifidobacterium parmae]
MKQYEQPLMTVITLNGTDIVRTSESNMNGGGNANNNNGEGNFNFGDLSGNALNY